jgi:hypothetical protein
MKPLATAVTAMMLGTTAAHAAPPRFGGEKTTWHGFDRYDFPMDESDLSIKPHQATPNERNGVRTQVKGEPSAGAVSGR